MFDLKACRCCLLTEGIATRLTEQNKKLYQMITGFEIKSHDGFPTHICAECSLFLKKVMQFRRKCRRAHFVLKEIMITNKQVTLKTLSSVDRKQSNLVSPLTQTQCEIIELFPNTPLPPSSVLDSDIGAFVDDKNDANTDAASAVKVKRSINIDGEIVNRFEDENVDDSNHFADDINNDDIVDESEDTRDIDMEDIFKGLKEDEDFCVESEPETEPQEIPDTKTTYNVTTIKKRNQKEGAEKSQAYNYAKFYGYFRRYLRLSKVVAHCDIEIQTEEQQIETHKKKLQDYNFKMKLYKCSLCISSYDHLDKLKQHVMLHNYGTKFQHRCQVCNLLCETEKDLKRHCANFHLYKFTCKFCRRSYNALEKLDRHESCFECIPDDHKRVNFKKALINKYFDKTCYTVEEAQLPPPFYEGTPNKYKCDVCKVHLSEDAQHGHAHIVTPKGSNSVQCDNCKTYYSSKESLIQHILKFHTYKYKCKVCDIVVYNEPQVERHLLLHNLVKCETCSQEFQNTTKLEIHKTRVHGNTKGKEDCAVCGDSFESVADLYYHQLQWHGCLTINDERICGTQNQCGVCNTYFMTKMALNKHLIFKKHADLKEIQNACKRCYCVFGSKVDLKMHICNPGTKYPKNCEWCDEKLSDSVEARKHNAECTSRLKSSKQVLCYMCGQVLSCQAQLTKHIRSKHGDEKANDYQCMFCKINLYKIDLFLMHILRSHTYRAYMCALCPNRFSGKGDCREHILRSHAPEKPYKCDFCGRGFSHATYLLSHAKKMHNVNLDKKKYHIKSFTSLEINGNVLICLYPYMKINVTNVPADIFTKVGIAYTDFLGNNPKPITNLDEVLVFGDEHPPIVELTKKPATKKKAKPSGGEPKNKKMKTIDHSFKPQIKQVKETVLDETKDAVETLKVEHDIGDYSTEFVVDEKDILIDEEKLFINEDDLLKDEKVEIIEQTELSHEELQEEIRKGNYEVVEHNGETCLLVNGTVYKVEETDEFAE